MMILRRSLLCKLAICNVISRQFNQQIQFMTKVKLHSEEYFGEQRNFWWNQDFMELMAQRLGLQNIKLGLDVGCGVGHWGRIIYRLLDEDATLIGIDQEEKWVEEASKIAQQEPYAQSKLAYQVAVAENLPFEDNYFDLVTCQTVLIHVKEPKLVIHEMLRVLKPGGTILLVEPNNQATAMVRGSHKLDQSIESRLNVIKFQMICEKGKEALGLGFNSIGDMVPLFLHELGVADIKIYQTDKAFAIIPPYAKLSEQVMLEQTKDWTQRNFWIWDQEDTLKYFVAGGGKEEEFTSLWNEVMDINQKLLDLIDSGQYCSAGGCITYLIAGIKPEETDTLGADLAHSSAEL